MNINKKIEEIRNKPESVRMKYVWISVFISMLLIFSIWVLSIMVMLKKDAPAKTKTNLPNFSNEFQKIKDSAPSIESLNSVDESVSRSE